MKRRKPGTGDLEEDDEDDQGSPLQEVPSSDEDEEPTSDVDSDHQNAMPKQKKGPGKRTHAEAKSGGQGRATALVATRRPSLSRHSASVTISTKPLMKKRLSGTSSTVGAQFKMPVPNYRPSGGKVATLGPRKPYAGVPGIQQLLSFITKHISNPEATGSTAAADEPLLIYDPEQDEDRARGATLKPVYVEAALAAKLRPHQREGVAFMFNCLAGLKTGGYTGAILMDGMGLGKTFQSICTLWTLVTTGISGQATCRRPLILCPPSLVKNWGNELTRWLGPQKVDPLVLDDTRGAVVKDAIERAWGSIRGLAAVAAGAGKQQVLVMSYHTFRSFKDAVYRKGVDLVVCDEAHFLKNSDSQLAQAVAGIPATRRLLLSGTPVQNDLGEFYSLFNVAVPGLFGTPAQFRKTYELPIARGTDAEASDKDRALAEERNTQMIAACGPYMLRRTCGVMAQYLPPKVEQVVFCRMSALQVKLYEHFFNSKPVQARLAGGRAAAREAAAAAATQQVPDVICLDCDGASPADGSTGGGAAAGGPGGRAGGAGKQSGKASGKAPGGAASGRASGKAAKRVSGAAQVYVPLEPELSTLPAITAVRKLCCHPDLVYDMVKPPSIIPSLSARSRPTASKVVPGVQGARASGSTQATQVLSPPASHTQALAGSAALAGGDEEPGRVKQAVITGFEGSLPLFSSAHAYTPGRCDPMHSGKIQVLVQMLKSIRQTEPTDKVVLVSNFTESLDILGKLFADQRWPCLRLDGSLTVQKRQPLVDSFNDPAHPSFILLLSSKAGGVGLNIIGANRLILFDPDWNPANDLQAMARVWREGQKKRVWIYRLLTTGSIEEKVYQRQLMKQDLSKSVVDEGGDGQPTQWSSEELRKLFRVDPGVVCDTHGVIRCSCDGQPATMGCKAAAAAARAAEEQAAREEARAAGDTADKAPTEAGVGDWAHLLDVLNSPDAIWKHVPPFVRQKFVTYLFSDHITNPPPVPVVQADEGQEEEEEEGGQEEAHRNREQYEEE